LQVQQPPREPVTMTGRRPSEPVAAACPAGADAGLGVVFLDVDGVLHSLYGEEVFAESCCKALEHIVRHGGARVVLANQWAREDSDRTEMVNNVLRSRGLAPLYGSVAEVPSGRPEVEICQWLSCHPEVVRWVVIDDADLEVSGTPEARRMAGHAVRTEKHVGLTAADAERAVAALRGEAWGPRPPMALTEAERARAEKSQAAQALHFEHLRNGGLAEMEKQFFGE